VDRATTRDAGGEPLWVVPQDVAIFFPTRRRPKMVLNRRLPEATARDVSPRAVSWIVYSHQTPTNVSRVEPFAGAACLTTFADVHRGESKNAASSGTTQSGSPPGRHARRRVALPCTPDSWILAPGSCFMAN
jgi:hypothetical protein